MKAHENDRYENMRDFYGDDDKRKNNKLNPIVAKTSGDQQPNENKSFDEDSNDEQKENFKRDMEYMRTTIKVESGANRLDGGSNSDEYFAFQEKCNDILEMHDEVLALHMNILKV